MKIEKIEIPWSGMGHRYDPVKRSFFSDRGYTMPGPDWEWWVLVPSGFQVGKDGNYIPFHASLELAAAVAFELRGFVEAWPPDKKPPVKETHQLPGNIREILPLSEDAFQLLTEQNCISSVNCEREKFNKMPAWMCKGMTPAWMWPRYRWL